MVEHSELLMAGKWAVETVVLMVEKSVEMKAVLMAAMKVAYWAVM